MFIDYLRLSYWIPNAAKPCRGDRHARQIAAEITEYKHRPDLLWDGTTVPHRIDKAHRSACQHEPTGSRVIMEWGGSAIPLHLADFRDRFCDYEGWTVSRIDLADNIPNASRELIYTGQAQSSKHYWLHKSAPNGEPIEIWNGCTIGKRGTQGSYFRVYNAAEETDKLAVAHKIARFGTTNFWRVEYELCRECLRKMGFDTLIQLDLPTLEAMWNQELHKKGHPVGQTTEYLNVRQRDNDLTTAQLADERRANMIKAMLRKMAPARAEALLAELIQEFAQQRQAAWNASGCTQPLPLEALLPFPARPAEDRTEALRTHAKEIPYPRRRPAARLD